MPEANKRGAVEIRQEKQKEVLIEELRKRPIVQSACQKVGIGRASYYRWRKEDPAFAQAVDEAMETGIGIVNDVAETQLMTAIREGNMTAVIFWLKHHHRSYTTRVELDARIKTDTGELTPEQEAAVRKALELAALNEPNPDVNAKPKDNR
jgi:predicted DNA binding protein